MGNPNLTHISRVLNLPDPQLIFKWVCSDIPFDLPTEYVESFDTNHLNNAVGEGVYVSGYYKNYPGTARVDPFQMSFYGDIKSRATKWLLAWKAKVWNPETGAFGLPIEYKKTITFKALDSKNNTTMTVKYIDVWPSDTSPYAFNYTDGTGRLIIQQSFSVDKVQITV